MIKIVFNTLIVISIITTFTMCNNEKSTTDSDNKQKDTAIITHEFSADSAYSYIKKQVDFGPRVPNTKAHNNCAEYLTNKLKEYTANVIVQKATVKAFDGTTLQIKNIIAEFNPDAKFRILLCSHWDSRPFADNDPDKSNYNKAIDGANDGASGVAVLLELARNIKLFPVNIGVDIIFLDAEDYGQPHNTKAPEMEDTWALGTQYWAKNPHRSGYKATYGILLDMVGAPNAKFLMEGYSMYYAPDVVRKIWNTASQYGYSDYFINERGNEITDDHYYINKIANIPCIDIIHTDKTTNSGFYKTWHTVDDNIKNIDANTLKAVGQTLINHIYSENIQL